MDTKTRPIYMRSTRDPLQTQGHIQTKSEGMEKDIPRKWKPKESWSSISDKINLKIKNVTRDKKGHYKMIKGSIQEEDIKIINIYAPNIGAPQYIRQLLTPMKEEIDSNPITVGDFNTSLTPMHRPSKHKL